MKFPPQRTNKPAINVSAPSSLSLAAPPSRYFTVRFFKGCCRFVFSRRMVWLLAILISLGVLYYQFENWNGARELKEARERMFARTGTNDYRTMLADEVPEEKNFFAIPVIKSWRVKDNNKYTAGGYRHQFPGDKLLPDNYDAPLAVEKAGRSALDLAAWEKKRAKSGKPIPEGQSAAAVIYGEIGDGRGIIPQLISGLDRPESQAIPCRKACYEAAGWELQKVKIPSYSSVFSTQNALAIHLRTAALSGDAAKTRDVARVMLRLGDAFNDPSIVSQLIGAAIHQVTLEALNEALGCRTLTDEDFRILTQWLAAANDVAQVESMFRFQMLNMDAAFASMRATQIRDKKLESALVASVIDKGDFIARQFIFSLLYGPSGWFDANHAFFLENALLHCGQPGDEGWRAGKKGAEAVAHGAGPASVLCSKGKFTLLNPRRALAILETPALTNIWSRAADNLFKRRCAILTCALRRHQLAHGTFPATLAELDAALLPSPQTDPAKAGAPMGYRPAEKGFLLWSVGNDRNDDSGDAEKDWLWSHEAM